MTGFGDDGWVWEVFLQNASQNMGPIVMICHFHVLTLVGTHTDLVPHPKRDAQNWENHHQAAAPPRDQPNEGNLPLCENPQRNGTRKNTHDFELALKGPNPHTLPTWFHWHEELWRGHA